MIIIVYILHSNTTQGLFTAEFLVSVLWVSESFRFFGFQTLVVKARQFFFPRCSLLIVIVVVAAVVVL